MEEENREVLKPENQTDNASAQNAPEQLGKFKNVDALLHAYLELESEFTRRSQRLKTLEEKLSKRDDALPAAEKSETLYRAVSENDEVRARVLSDYLQSLKGVPLMTGSGIGVTAPISHPKNIAEAGTLALGYLRNQKN